MQEQPHAPAPFGQSMACGRKEWQVVVIELAEI
jgi:hypothetical protein